MGAAVSRSACGASSSPSLRKGKAALKKMSRSSGSSTLLAELNQHEFYGIARVEVLEAQLPRAACYFATVSLGMQTFRSQNSAATKAPVWKAEKKMVLEEKGARIARIAVFEVHRMRRSACVGFCDLDLSVVVDPEAGLQEEWLDLRHPTDRSTAVGSIRVAYKAEPQEAIERDFARKLLSLMDYDGNGQLSQEEFTDLIKALGNAFSTQQIQNLFTSADVDKDGHVSADELAATLEIEHLRVVLVNRCPVCGEALGGGGAFHDMLHMWLCFDEGSGNTPMEEGYLTQRQASMGWMFKMNEWGYVSSYDQQLRRQANAGHILVFERKTKRLVEELIDAKIVFAMRVIYQSKIGRSLMEGSKSMLVSMSEKQGLTMNRPESAAHIPQFVQFFQDQLDVSEVKRDIKDFKTFNEFFIRELKPGVRPIAYPGNGAVAVCSADSRTMVYASCEEAQRFWIKGRKFSIPGLLADQKLGQQFEGGALVIFRLAPQDYHRFHMPVAGTLTSIELIPGNLFTVNPIAINSKFADVFTENKRARVLIKTAEFGDVAYVAVGATMVGSITFTAKVGAKLSKGDELGYFSFGGSTCICVFQKGRIEFDEDLVANSVRSLETLVQVGMTLGVAAGETLKGPSAADSVVCVDTEIAKKGIAASKSVNARHTALDPEEPVVDDGDERDDGA